MTFCHQVIKAALEGWKRMCLEEEQGVRPIHRPREWRREQRRFSKEGKKTSWHQAHPGQVSDPLIIDPVPGDLLQKMKSQCEKFETAHGVKVQICLKAGC